MLITKEIVALSITKCADSIITIQLAILVKTANKSKSHNDRKKLLPFFNSAHLIRLETNNFTLNALKNIILFERRNQQWIWLPSMSENATNEHK